MRVSASNNLRYARIAGVSYLFIIGLGIVAQVIVRDRFVDYNDAGVTAGAILNNEFLFRLGFVCQLFMLVFDVIVTSLLFLLLRPVAGD